MAARPAFPLRLAPLGLLNYIHMEMYQEIRSEWRVSEGLFSSSFGLLAKLIESASRKDIVGVDGLEEQGSFSWR